MDDCGFIPAMLGKACVARDRFECIQNGCFIIRIFFFISACVCLIFKKNRDSVLRCKHHFHFQLVLFKKHATNALVIISDKFAGLHVGCL